MKRVYLLLAHPNKTSFNGQIADAYEKAAKEKGILVRRQNLGEMKFSFDTKKEMEKDLQIAQKNISWCDHLVIIYPMWWGLFPAVLKGFFDRVLQSGFAFKYHKNNPIWDKLLEGKSAEIISTCDGPKWWITLAYRNCDFIALKQAILGFCGIKPIKFHRIARVRFLNKDQREKEIQKVANSIKN